MRPTSIHEVAYRRAASPDVSLWKPMNEFLDAFYEGECDRRAMLESEPVGLADRREHAYLAAATEYLCAAYQLGSPPSWTEDPACFLDQAYWVEDWGHAGRMLMMAESPTSFRRRFIFTERFPLRRKAGPVFS